jgi:hypothetical protein
VIDQGSLHADEWVHAYLNGSINCCAASAASD